MTRSLTHAANAKAGDRVRLPYGRTANDSDEYQASSVSGLQEAKVRDGDLSGQSLPVMRRELVCGFPTVSWSADSKGDRGGVAEGRLVETVGTFPLHAEQRAGRQ